MVMQIKFDPTRMKKGRGTGGKSKLSKMMSPRKGTSIRQGSEFSPQRSNSPRSSAIKRTTQLGLTS